MDLEPNHVIFDGMDGSGKGTQIALFKKEFEGRRVVFTREPGGTPLAEDIREVLLSSKLTPRAQFLLFWAAREHVKQEVVMPALRSGKHVFSDRGDSATWAYQVREDPSLKAPFASKRKRIFEKENGQHPPDLYIIFDLPAKIARDRALKDLNRSQNHFDVRELRYYERVREGFKDFASQGFGKVEFIDAARSPEQVYSDVQMILARERIITE